MLFFLKHKITNLLELLFYCKEKFKQLHRKKMKYQIKLSIFISFLLINCSVKKTEFEIICTKKVSKEYSYNPLGFIENSYGKLNIKTISHYDKEGKLKEVFWNRSDGFLKYTLSELKNDVALLNSFDIDTIYSDKKYISYIKEKKNDTIFYLSNDEVIIEIKKKGLD